MKKHRVLVLVNREKDKNLLFTKEVVDFLSSKNIEVCLEDAIYKEFPYLLKIDNTTEIDFVLVLGGDGTLIDALHRYINNDYKYFGINLGRVGCLLEATIHNYKTKIEAILKNNCMLEHRNVIAYAVVDAEGHKIKGEAFNEVSLERGRLFKMLKVNMYINYHNKTSFYADGVVVATSTGSSAFNLSCGGPLLLPDAKNYVITPICPQLRSITSLIVNDKDIITIDIKNEGVSLKNTQYKPVVMVDGRTMIEIDEDSLISIEKSDKILKIIKVDSEIPLFEPTFKVSMSSYKSNFYDTGEENERV